MAMKARYTVIDGEIISETRGATQRSYVPDANGSTVAMLNDSATVTDTFTYWPYGEVKTRTGSTPTPFRYVGTYGYFRDSGSVVYARGRYLNVTIARWLTSDPAGTVPSYEYVDCSPMTFVDPAGYQKVQPRRGKRYKDPQAKRLPYVGLSYSLDWTYGAYCGSKRIKNPGFKIEPQDCTDSCCRDHDRCIEAHYAGGYSEQEAHVCCDEILINCASWASYSDCCDRSEDPVQCKKAAAAIHIGFRDRIAPYYRLQVWYSVTCLPQDTYPILVRAHWGNPTCKVPEGAR